MVPIRVALVGFLLGLILGTSHAHAAPVGPPSASPAPDITHYDLEIRPDFATKNIRIRAALRIENPGLDSVFWFSLGDRYTARVRDGDRSLEVRRDGTRLAVVVSPPRKVHDLAFDIEGSPGRSDDEKRDVVGSHDLFLLWSDRFYPVSFEDWATLRTTISLPPGFQAIAPGRLTHTRRTGKDVTYVFETTRPTRLFSVFADDRWIRSSRRVRGMVIETLLHPEMKRYEEQIARSSADVVGYYRELFGSYEFDQFSFITLDSIYARRAFPGFVGYSSAYLEKELTRTGHDAHETALLWWGYTLGGTGPGSFQWIEGFGDYAEVLYDEDRQLPLSHNLARFKADYLATPIEGDLAYSDLRGNTPQKFVHGKLPWLMHLIRFVHGDDAFRHGMRLLFERHRFRAISMDEFTATLEEGLGSKLDWWRTEWLERKGAPELRMEADVDSLQEGYRVHCRVQQIGLVYHLPLELEIDTVRGRRIERVALSDSAQAWTFEVRDRPVRVTVDPNGWLPLRARPEASIDLASP